MNVNEAFSNCSSYDEFDYSNNNIRQADCILLYFFNSYFIILATPL